MPHRKLRTLQLATYNALRPEILKQLKHTQHHDDYEAFDPADYIDNPIALARINAGITQKELAKLMHVTQAYISKIENNDKGTLKMLTKVKAALEKE